MQTFLPYPDFEESAYSLDRQRLCKQRLETLQILQSLTGFRLVTSETVHTGIFVTTFFDDVNDEEVPESELIPGRNYRADRNEIVKTRKLPREEWRLEPLLMPGWKNHPAVKMWRGCEWKLLEYQAAVCEVWTGHLGYQDSCFDKTLYLYFHACPDSSTRTPSWLGDPEFHRSHQSNLIRKYPEHYRPQFPDVPDDLPYIWPDLNYSESESDNDNEEAEA